MSSVAARLAPGAFPVRYVLDADDQLIAVNDAWNAFATGNDAPNLQASAVIGRHLWSFITDADTVVVYRELLRRVREGTTMSLPFRCDSPTVRREMHLVMSPLDHRAVECSAFCDVEIPTSPVPLWAHHATSSGATIGACGWCKRVCLGTAWVEAEDAVAILGLLDGGPSPTVSHSICPECAVTLRRTLSGKF